jgi:hypothetical protein
MNTKNATVVLAITLVALALTGRGATSAAAATNSAATPAGDAEARYTSVIEGRAAEVLAALGMTNTAAESRVRDALLAQYRALRTWHDANDAAVKELRKAAASTNQVLAAAARQKAAGMDASLKSLHDDFVRRLSAELTPEQVETVKDKMTYNKVRVTYDAYCDMLPSLTADQKARILGMLKEAREDAMDAGSAEEKSAVFKKYKGRINIYLSSQGYDMGKAAKDWAQRLKEKRPARPSEPAAPAQGEGNPPR